MNGQVHAAALPWRYGALSLLLGVAVAFGYLALRDAPAVGAIEGQTLGWRFQLRGAVAPPPSIAVVALDDRTVAALRRWPLPRQQIAAMVSRLASAGAAAIGVDLLFTELEQPSNGLVLGPGDQALVEALRATDRDVLALAFTFAAGAAPDEAALQVARGSAFRVVTRPAGIDDDATLRATGVLAPIATLPDVAAFAHVHTPVGGDGVLRAMPAAIALGDLYVPALPVALVQRARGLGAGQMALHLERGLDFGGSTVALDRRLRLPIAYYGPPGMVPTISALDLLEGRVPDSAVAGRIVLIGATALGLGDLFVTPFSQTMPGVEVLATLAANLYSGAVLQRAGLEVWDVAAIVILGFAAFAIARLPSPVAVVGAAAGLAALWFAVAQFAFVRGLWLDVTFPSAAILLNAGAVAVVRATIERGMRRNLSRYHSPVIVGMLAERATPRFEGSAQNAAILFVDMAGSTARLETMAPEDAVRLLRDFHGRIERAVLAHEGVVEKFMGDGAMVVFGIPKPRAGDAAAALACARALIDDIRAHNAELAAAGVPPIDVSVGIHYGPVIMARLGGATQAEITAAGDTVNVASRLEALTRANDAAIVISDAAVEAIRAAGRLDLIDGFERLPPQEIRGRVERLAIWVRRRAA